MDASLPRLVVCAWAVQYGDEPCEGFLTRYQRRRAREGFVTLCERHTCTVRGEHCRIMVRAPPGAHKRCPACGRTTASHDKQRVYARAHYHAKKKQKTLPPQ